MEPPVRFERTTFALPRRRSDRQSYEGMSWVPRARTWKRRRVKACRVCQFPHHPSRAPDRLRTDALTLTRRPLCLLSYRGAVRSAGVEPASAWLSTKPVAARAHGASGRSRTACLPRTKRTLWPGELQRHELGNQGSNLDSLASGASVLPGYTIPHQIGEDSVRRQGFEPRTLPIKSRML